MSKWEMDMRKCYCLLIPLLLLVSVSGAAEWVNLTSASEPVQVNLLDSNGQRTIVNYQLSGYSHDQIELNGTLYDVINLDHESRLWERGNPDLPRLCRSIIIPDEGIMAARIVSSEYRDIEGVKLLPSKGHFSRTTDPKDVPYEFGATYQVDAWYPGNIVELRDPYIMRDVRGQVIELNAFQYNPVTEVLRVYTNITVEVTKVAPGGVNVLNRQSDLEVINHHFKNIYDRHFLNSSVLDYVAVEEEGTMLVICYDPWVDIVQPLVDWKNQKGIPTTLVPVSEIGNNSTAIKNYIINEFNTNNLTWVLLVGDAAQVATPGGEDPTYGQILGNDSYFEVIIGRFSSETVAQVQTQVTRTLQYETDPVTGDWFIKGLGIASNQGQGIGHYGEGDWEHMDLIRHQLLEYNYVQVDQQYDPTATVAGISNSVNEGRGIVNYCGHGSTTSWGTTGFNNGNVNNLVNDNMLPFITSVACNNGTFPSSTCFAEAWTRAEHNGVPTGAVGFWGSNISQSWAPPMYAQDEVIDLLTPELKWSFGALCFNGAMLMIDETGSSGANEADNWCIFGDPSVMVWANVPQTLTVAHDNQIDPGNPTFPVTISGIEGGLAAISVDGVLYGSAYSNSQGLATIPIVPGTLPPQGYATLTVTAFNHAPYIVQIPIVAAGPDLYPPLIAHDPLESTTGAGPYTISATIMDYSGVASASVFYSTDGVNFDEAAMTDMGDDVWEGDIPGQTPGTVVDYYIEATDSAPAANVGTSETWSFSVLAILFTDDFETGMGEWTHDACTPTWIDQWHMSTQSSHSGVTSWKFGDTGTGNYAPSSDGGLVSPVITIGDDCELTFWHRMDAEASGAYPDSAYDGGVVEISFNGGAWTTLPMNYTHIVRTTAGGGNPYTGPFPPNTPLFSGNFGWTEADADLSTFVGDIQLRFRFGSDAAGEAGGWMIDDVQIIGLPTGSLPLIDVDLTYISGSPVPAGGGNLVFDTFVENVDVTPLDFDAWIETAYEGGPPTTLITRNLTDFQVGWQINRPAMFIPIPAAYAAGNYTLTGKVGVYPGVVWNQDGFPYVKSGVDIDPNFVPFEIVADFPNPFGGEPTMADMTVAAPERFIMHGNYPNPFNPTTNFSFSIPQAEHVTLKVFNLQGQLVETLVDGMRDAGAHNVTFDASALSSGIYLYQLTAGSDIASGKMVLVK